MEIPQREEATIALSLTTNKQQTHNQIEKTKKPLITPLILFLHINLSAVISKLYY